jgi:hypothetical protein
MQHAAGHMRGLRAGLRHAAPAPWLAPRGSWPTSEHTSTAAIDSTPPPIAMMPSFESGGSSRSELSTSSSSPSLRAQGGVVGDASACAHAGGARACACTGGAERAARGSAAGGAAAARRAWGAAAAGPRGTGAGSGPTPSSRRRQQQRRARRGARGAASPDRVQQALQPARRVHEGVPLARPLRRLLHLRVAGAAAGAGHRDGRPPPRQPAAQAAGRTASQAP